MTVSRRDRAGSRIGAGFCIFVPATLLALGLSQCSPSGRDSAEGGEPYFLADRGVIIPDSAAKGWRPCTDAALSGDVSGFWTPPETLKEEIDRRLPAKLDSALQRLPWEGHKPQPSDYHRQYIGMVVDGRRMIFVNGFHHSHVSAMVRTFENIAAADSSFHHVGQDFWKQSLVATCDGGAWYFGVTYEPNAHRFGPILFNSPS